MSRTVFLTGGAGRIGKHVLQMLLDRGYKVRVLVHKHEPEGITSANMELVQGDMLDRKSFADAVAGCHCVCHLAAIFDLFDGPVYETDNDLMYEHIVTASYNVIESARAAGSVEQFVLGSTDAVYAVIFKQYDEPITEETEVFPRPGRFYALAKATAENLCNYYEMSYGLPYTILRIGWCLNYDEILKAFSYDFWHPMMIAKDRDALRSRFECGQGAICPVYPTGESVVVHLGDAKDVATGFFLAIDKPDQARNQIFNVAGPAPIRYGDVVELVAGGLGVPWEKATVEGLREYEISNEKARRMLGYEPVNTVAKMIEMAVQEGVRSLV